MLRPKQKKKLIGHQIKFDSFPYEISMEIGWPYKNFEFRFINTEKCQK